MVTWFILLPWVSAVYGSVSLLVGWIYERSFLRTEMQAIVRKLPILYTFFTAIKIPLFDW